MQIKFFTVPGHDPQVAEEELNGFLAGHRILAIDRQLVQNQSAAYWAVCVTWLEGEGKSAVAKRGKIDYREVLPAAEFAVYSRLRALRKTLADREGVPAYALFTNEQLAAMVRQRVDSAAALGKIPGIGAARVEKYGPAFLEVLTAAAATLAAGEGESGEQPRPRLTGVPPFPPRGLRMTAVWPPHLAGHRILAIDRQLNGYLTGHWTVEIDHQQPFSCRGGACLRPRSRALKRRAEASSAPTQKRLLKGRRLPS